MKLMFCWRCQMDIPMLDEEEYALLHEKFKEAFSPGKGSLKERFRPALEAYEALTGFHEENPNAVMHHRIALYGPPCEACGKPLRTPEARFCAICGQPRLKPSHNG